MTRKVRIGIAGTSWWADAMYLPALVAITVGTAITAPATAASSWPR